MVDTSQISSLDGKPKGLPCRAVRKAPLSVQARDHNLVIFNLKPRSLLHELAIGESLPLPAYKNLISCSSKLDAELYSE